MGMGGTAPGPSPLDPLALALPAASSLLPYIDHPPVLGPPARVRDLVAACRDDWASWFRGFRADIAVPRDRRLPSDWAARWWRRPASLMQEGCASRPVTPET